MALRASYYGLKKRILDKVLGDYDAVGVMTNKEITENNKSVEIVPVIATAAEGKITINSASHVIKKNNVVSGSIRLTVTGDLTAGIALVQFPLNTYELVYTVGIDTATGATIPLIISHGTNLANILLFGAFVPTTGHDIIIPINFISL